MDTNVPPPVNIQNKIYSTLDPVQEKDAGVNLLGNLVPLRKTCEFFDLAAQMGAGPVRHVTDYQTFAQFQEMAKSQRNLVLTPAGKYSAEQMQKKHGIPYTMALVSYDPEGKLPVPIRELPKHWAFPARIPAPMRKPVTKPWRKLPSSCKGCLWCWTAKRRVRPFDFARGVAQAWFPGEAGIGAESDSQRSGRPMRGVQQHAPDLSVQQPQHHKAVRFEDRLPDCLAVGYNSGYLTGSQHVVAADGQQGLFGYQGFWI